MNKQARDIINQVFAQINESGERFYPRHTDAAGCPHADKMRYPRGAGDKCYEDTATAFRLTGDDPGQSVSDPVNVPQEIITANRKAFNDGLLQAFPDNAMRDYFRICLQEENFPTEPDTHYSFKRQIIARDLPAIRADEMGKGESGRCLSLAHDIRNSFGGRADDVFRPRHDRRNLTKASTLHAYGFLRENPALYLAFELWQRYLINYCDILEDKIYNAVLPPHIAAESDVRVDVSDRFPLHHLVAFTRASAGVPQQVLFYSSAVLGNNAMTNGIENPDAARMTEGLEKMRAAGFFRRSFDSAWGNRKIICPFGNTAIRWLTMDMGAQGNPDDALIAQCLDRVTSEMPYNDHLQRAAGYVSGAMDDVISRGDYQVEIGEEKMRVRTKRKDFSL